VPVTGQAFIRAAAFHGGGALDLVSEVRRER
jgi:hypothetical protein